MDKLLAEISSHSSLVSTNNSPEKRGLTETKPVMKRPGGNYGSLAKSQLQPNHYVSHRVESDDTLQRLALKYSVNVQEIKRVNKLWSDAELRLLETVFIPVNPSQLSTLRSLYPTLNVVQSASPTMNRTRKSSTSSMPNDECNSSLQSSDSSASIATTTTTTAKNAFQDYFSKIDHQIRSSKKSLESLDIDKKYQRPHRFDNSHSLHASNGNNSDDSTSSQTSRTKIWNNGRNNGIHHVSDSNVFVSISSQSSRDRHVSAALERIEREKDDFDAL